MEVKRFSTPIEALEFLANQAFGNKSTDQGAVDEMAAFLFLNSALKEETSAALASRLHDSIACTMDIPDEAVEAALNYRIGRATLDTYITWPGSEMRGNMRQFAKYLVLETLRAWK